MNDINPIITIIKNRIRMDLRVVASCVVLITIFVWMAAAEKEDCCPWVAILLAQVCQLAFDRSTRKKNEIARQRLPKVHGQGAGRLC